MSKFVTCTLFCCLLFLCTSARDDRDTEILAARADSAIEAGELPLAARYTREALQLARTAGDEQEEAKLLINLISIKIEEENNADTDEWFDRVSAIGEKYKDRMLLANLWNIKARQLMYNQQYDAARSYYDKVWQVYKNLGEDVIVAYYYNDLGYLAEAEGDPRRAADWYLKAIGIFEKTPDKSGLANTLGNLANTYFNLNEKEKALSFAKRSVDIRLQTGDKEGIAIVYGNITRIYLHMEQMDSARHYQEAYLRYAQMSGKKKTLADSYVNLAMMHHAGGRYTEAASSMQHAIGLGKEINHPNLTNFYRMCALFLGKMKKIPEMNRYYDSCYALLVRYQNKAHFRDYYATRMNYFRTTGDYKQALEHYDLYIRYKDSILNEETKKQVAQYEVQYETQKKNAQIQAEKSERVQQQLYYNIALSVLAIGLMSGLFLFNRYSYRKKLEQKNLLLSERNRISSELHDEVGSSLSAIHLISHAAMNQTAQASPQLRNNLEKISQNTRHTMESISDIVWSMNPENDQIARISARMNTFATEILEAADCDFDFSVDERLLPLRLSPQKSRDLYLVFKEAINNASKYAGASAVQASLTQEGNDLLLRITDDGRGFDTGTVHRDGNGLKNIRKRVEKHGGSYRLESAPGKGTSIHIQIPYA